MNPMHLHPEYTPSCTRRRLSLDLYEGGGRVEEGHYLIRHGHEENRQWRVRKERVAYRNFAAPIVDLFSGFINEGRPARNLPASLHPLERDADRFGKSANAFFEVITRLAAAGGTRFVLVDREAVPEGTRAEAVAAGRRDLPYFVSVNPDNVLDWQIDSRGLAWAALRETTMETREPGEATQWCETVTVWTRTEWIRYAKTGNGKGAGNTRAEAGKGWVETERGTHPCGEVPLVPFFFEESSPMTGLAVTDDVLSLILKVYRNDSELDKMLFDRAVPEKIINGITEKQLELYATSTYNCLFSEEKNGIDATYVEPSGTSFDALSRQIAKDETSIREIALRMTRPATGAAESAEAKRLDRRQLDTQLAAFARSCADAEAHCWRLAGKWTGMNLCELDSVSTPYQQRYGEGE